VRTQEDLVQYSRDKLVEFKETCLKLRRVYSELEEEAKSPLFSAIIRRKREALDAVRREYGGIVIKGATDRDVVLALCALQQREAMLQEEVSRWDAAEESVRALDEQLAVCNDVLADKGKQARIER
jgi:hypothetical protein